MLNWAGRPVSLGRGLILADWKCQKQMSCHTMDLIIYAKSTSSSQWTSGSVSQTALKDLLSRFCLFLRESAVTCMCVCECNTQQWMRRMRRPLTATTAVLPAAVDEIVAAPLRRPSLRSRSRSTRRRRSGVAATWDNCYSFIELLIYFYRI